MRIIKALALSAILLIGWSCSISSKEGSIADRFKKALEGDYRVSEEFARLQPRSVAILPFVNQTKSDQAFEVVRRTFYNHFSSLPYIDLELYQVDARLEQANLLDGAAVAGASPQRLGESLKVDAVIYGEVNHYDRVYAAVYSQVAVGARLQMVDTRTGEILWTGEHTARKHEGGVSTTPVGLIFTAISTAVNVREIELFRASDDLFRTMVQSVPAPTLAEARRPPKITILVQDAVDTPKKSGDVIRVAMEGDPRLQASFDIGELKGNIPMIEEGQGSYVGEYKVLPGDNVEGAIVVGRLTDDGGNSSKWIDVLGTVTIDTEPPPPPQGLRAIGRDQRVLLSWESNIEKDLAGYRVYRSDTPLTGYGRIADLELTKVADRTVENGRSYYYRVTALDLAGNESLASVREVGNPVAPGPTLVEGEISADTTWLAGASPYVLVGEVEVADKVLLIIESGTEIVSAGPGLTVRGLLQAVGKEGRSIFFHGSEQSLWQGIRFLGGGESIVKFCRISDAEVGLVCRAGSPQINFCELAGNGIALRVEEAFAKPSVWKNTFRDNRQAALEVLAAAAPRIEHNSITNNQGVGIRLDTAGGVLRANSITNNKAGGILASGATTIISQNNIHHNQLFDLRNDSATETLAVSANWWGTTEVLPLLAKVQGRVDLSTLLNGAYPDGKEIELNIAPSPLKGKIEQDVYLTQAHSPYVVAESVVIDGGAILTIQAGVELRFNPGDASLVVRDGGLNAQGAPESPIIFTSNSVSGSPGFYDSAVRFEMATEVASLFKYCVFRHAVNGLMILHGSPDIAYSLIAHNSQSGIQCRNNATPKIFYGTLRDNVGTGAIVCYGRSAPKVYRNNIYRNAFAIQSFSTLYVDARENWWGSGSVDPGWFIGQVNKTGALETPVPEAFDPEASEKGAPP